VRLLHVISGLDPQNGGPTTALFGLASAQAAAGVDVTILATWKIPDGIPVAEELRRRGVKVIHVGPATGKLSRHHTLTAHCIAAVAEADVAHIHGLFEEVQHQTARACRRLKKPYVITPHGMLSPWNMSCSKWGKRLYMIWRLRKDLDRAAAIHFTSDVERDLVVPMKIKAKPIVERLGLDLSEFESLPPRGEFRRKHPQLADRPIILFLGRIDYKKGLDVLVPAFATARFNGDPVLVIAGPDRDGYEPTVRKMVADHKLENRVLFTGMLHGRERIEAYVDADFFVLTSHQENFGITVIEAMACGCPVFISDQVNIHAEVSKAGGGVVTTLNPDAVREGLASYANDPARRADDGRRGREFALREYNWATIAEEWNRLYAAL
jgi:glycosyltransferase involved in cell wall biosynthesis